MSKIKVLVVDDNLVIRQGLRSLLDGEEDITVKGEASTGSEAMHWMKRFSADVVLMDIQMPIIDGIVATAGIMLTNPDARILVLTVTEDADVLAEAIHAGAKGYMIYNGFEPDELIQAIHAVATGEMLPVSPAVKNALIDLSEDNRARQVAEQSISYSLTIREYEILELIADGKSNAEIAEVLDVGEKTVKITLPNYMPNLRSAVATKQFGSSSGRTRDDHFKIPRM